VVLGNHKDIVWPKSDLFAPVLCGDSLCFLVSLAVAMHCPLSRGDCKNAFCQGILPPEKIRIVHPPSGDPEAASQEDLLLLCTLNGLRHSPGHWYDKINAIFQSIGLTPCLEDPCLYSGFIQDPNDRSGTKSASPLILGLYYVGDFVYFSEDPIVEALFFWLPSECCKVDFIGIFEWFLGVHILWGITHLTVVVSLDQSGFASNLFKIFSRYICNPMPTATPCCSGIPIT
jgi:hypothetical protein